MYKKKKEAIKTQCYGTCEQSKTKQKKCCPSTNEYISRADPILRSDLIAFFAQFVGAAGPRKLVILSQYIMKIGRRVLWTIPRLRDGTVWDHDDESTYYGEFAMNIKIFLQNTLCALA